MPRGNLTPNDTATFASTVPTGVLSDMETFADFMRMLGPPTQAQAQAQAQATASTTRGLAQVKSVGCALCHTPVLMTGAAIADDNESAPSAALSNQPARLFSDLLVHHMGAGLADGITQGAAGPGTSSVRHRSGVWVSTYSSCTTAGPAT